MGKQALCVCLVARILRMLCTDQLFIPNSLIPFVLPLSAEGIQLSLSSRKDVLSIVQSTCVTTLDVK
jgi:hypothetical protein